MWDACGGWYDNKSHLIQVGLEIIDDLTKVLPSPDVHVGVILAEVVEPTPVHDEDPTSDDGSPAEWRKGRSYKSSLARLFMQTSSESPEGNIFQKETTNQRSLKLYFAQQMLCINYFAAIWTCFRGKTHHKRTANTNIERTWLWRFILNVLSVSYGSLF